MRGKGRNELLPNSLRIISSCLKTVSSNAGSVASTVRSAGASVAASITAEDDKDQVLWVGFDKLELGPQSFKHVLLLGYSNGFQVLNVEDASNFCELVSKRDGPVTFLQMQPIPAKSEGSEGFRASHPLLLVVAGDETNGSGMVQGGRLSALIREKTTEPLTGNGLCAPTVVRFYSLKSHSYVHVLRFRSAVFIVRCSPRVIAVALAAQIYCFDAVTLENKFSVLTYPLQGAVGVNIGYGSMSVGPRWLAYTSNNPLLSNIGCLSPQNLTPSPGVSPSTSPGSGSLVARYAMESSKQLASGILNLGDMGYKTLSKYCHELLPDGLDSPSSSNSCRRLGRLPSSAHPSEADNAGIVVVKDFVSKDVISQFRAHTSPISALCFDPSGTLLVTASVHGHNINIFRILPVRIPNGSSSVRYDWTSSHVHLYKLYRGLTTAVIQDICFSDYSQWISILSSRGTCHIFTLSPFGGDASLQQQSPNSAGPILTPNLSPPWWSCSSCTADQQFLPPPPVTLSVISRIKNGNSGWLSTVSNAAASATGKITVPSGALAAVFHNSIYHYTLPVQPNASALERLLVYSPSGHVIQYELLPSTCVESSYSSPRTGSGPLSQLQDDDLRVNAEPVQWWDVCRRSNWPERDENISLILHDKQIAETVIASSDYEDSDTTYLMPSTSNMAEKGFLKPHERHNWYLSNAEVQINSGRIPIWEKPKICFYMMVPLKTGGRSANIHDNGEIEIEKVPFHEVEIRRKDLLPVFEQFHSSQANWSNRGIALGAINQASSSESREARGMPIKDPSARHSKPTSYASESNFGTCEPISFQLEGSTPNKYVESSDQTPHSKLEDEGIGPIMSRKYYGNNCASSRSEHSTDNSHMDECVINHSPYSSPNCLPFGGRPVIEDTCSSSIDSDQTGTVGSYSSPKLAHYFQESYCKVSEELDDCRDLTGVVTDADSSSSHCERAKVEEGDGDNDDMLGGVFAFSEEG